MTSYLWLLTLKDRLQEGLLWFTTKDSRTGSTTWRSLIILQTDLFEDLQISGLLILQEPSELPKFSRLMWRLILFTIWTFRLSTLQEFIDLLTFNGLTNWLTILALQILSLLTAVEQTSLLTVNGLPSLLTLFT